jgi:thiamine-phosphate pyrophosphorylase
MLSPRDDVRARVRGLYGLADADASGGQPLVLLDALLAGGCRLVQLRCKGWSSERLLPVAVQAVARARSVGATLIVNDDAQVAALADADGVHVGQHDADGATVRAVVGPHRIVGRSTHDPEGLRSARSHADYVAFGPVFPTRPERLSWNKPPQSLERLRHARQAAGDTPLVAIGGIDASRIDAVRSAGADAWAVIGAVADHDDPVAATARLLRA